MPTGQLVNLPAGAPLRPTGQPFNRSTNRSVICHPFSPCPTSGGRWQPQVAGGGCSALPHRLSHLSSVIDSVIHSALPEAARSARSADPTSRQCPEITKNDEPRTRNSPDQHPLCRDAVPTLPQGRHYPDTRYSILNTLGYSNPNPYP